MTGQAARSSGSLLHTGRDGPGGWPLDRAPTLLETSVPGVFAAGVRHASVKRVTTAMGEGATVVQLIHQHLESHPQVDGMNSAFVARGD